MSTSRYSEDIAHIRSMMERSSRFLSLSGWAGILPGIWALAGLSLAARLITASKATGLHDHNISRNSPLVLQLILIALTVLALSVFTSWYACMRKARKEKQSTWTPAIRNMLVYLSIPLVAGAIIAGWCYSKELWVMIAPVLLSFYGLALVQVSQFTLRSVLWLGLLEMALSIPAGIPGWGIPALAAGFGFAHIVYGILMFNRQPA